jgi:hypothetical protein
MGIIQPILQRLKQRVDSMRRTGVDSEAVEIAVEKAPRQFDSTAHNLPFSRSADMHNTVARQATALEPISNPFVNLEVPSWSSYNVGPPFGFTPGRLPAVPESVEIDDTLPLGACLPYYEGLEDVPAGTLARGSRTYVNRDDSWANFMDQFMGE